MGVPKDLKEFVGLLNSHGVEYVIVGGYAVAYHGHPRTTGDIDVFVRSTPENSARVAAALRAFGFGSLGIEDTALAEPYQILQLGVPPNRIDVITTIDGIDFEEAWMSRVAGSLDEVRAEFIGRDALIRNKKASGRLQDLADVERISEL